ncbi:MAG: methyltransferase domain-containing protein [Caldilineales bacterium]|nr:methyltransferase domain-containing protein [Caldilineales bacterium]
MVAFTNPQQDSAAFDAFAEGYDADFSDRILGRMLRRRVWDALAKVVRPGEHVLELNCGTGEDAVWLAQQGLRVTATDGSPEMLAVAAEKVRRAGLDDKVGFKSLDIGHWILDIEQDPNPQSPIPNPLFDGALSNFGGLNVLSDWRPLAENLAAVLKPGGWAVLVPMGPVCPWEMLWHLAHGDASTASRRFRQPAHARIGDATIPIWYPSARRLRADFAPWFEHIRTESLGLWLPPSYLAHLVERHPRLFARLDRLERRTARLTRGWGDHYIMLFSRR